MHKWLPKLVGKIFAYHFGFVRDWLSQINQLDTYMSIDYIQIQTFFLGENAFKYAVNNMADILSEPHCVNPSRLSDTCMR